MMSFCPECSYEYEPGIIKCPDCNVELVDVLPTPVVSAAIAPDESWIPAGLVNSQIKSDLAKGALDSNNIPSVILSSVFNAYGKNLDFSGGVSLSASEGNIVLVPKEFKEEALFILEAVLGDDLIQPGNH